MKKGWTEVALGEILSPRQETPSEDSLASGDVRVISKIKFASGKIEFRPTGETKTGMILVCPGDLVVSGINAAKGAIAIYSPNANANAAATIHYGAYEVNSKIADIKFIWWLLRSAEFRRILDHFLPGGIKTELKAKRLLPIPVPLPPLAEQQRIVAHLDAIEQRLKRIQKLREESEKKTLALVQSCIHEEHCKGIRHIPMSELVEWRKPDTDVFESESYTFAGVYSFGRGVFRKEAKSGMEFKYDRLTRLKANEFTYPKLMAWEGALGIVPEECDGCFVSPEFPVFTVNADKILPEIIDIHFKSPLVWTKLGRLSTGTNLRRRRLNPNAFLEYVFPLPPMDVQKGISALSFRVKKKADLARQASIRQEALIPSLLDSIFNS